MTWREFYTRLAVAVGGIVLAFFATMPLVTHAPWENTRTKIEVHYQDVEHFTTCAELLQEASQAQTEGGYVAVRTQGRVQHCAWAHY